jgi:hypothetical protein
MLQDEPQAEVKFSAQTGTELGIPSNYGGGGMFCVATITFPEHTGRHPAVGYKTAGSSGNPDEWNILCSKALGRALKRCGYPDDTVDLKALVHWRQRVAEIAAIGAGTAQLQLSSAPLDQAIEASGTSRDAISQDDGEAPNTETDTEEIEEIEIVDDGSDELADEAKIVAMRQLLGTLDPAKQKEVTAWARKKGIRTTQPDLTHGQVDTVTEYVSKISGAIENGHGSTQADLIVQLVESLTDDEAKVFRKFCKDNGIDDGVALNAPGTLSAEDIATLIGWLDAG